jgi:CRP/FNR family cyclic AMP-dependent transcriptional regulator
MPVDAARLDAVPAFAGLSEDDRETIAAAGDVVEVPSGAVLTAEGEFGYTFFVVEDGTAAVSDHGQQLGELGPGDFFGEIGLLVTGRRTASVTSTTPMRLLALFDQDFRRVCANVPAFERLLRETMAARFGAGR